MSHYPIAIGGSDTGSLTQNDKLTFGLAVGGGILGYLFGKGKTSPMILGAAIGAAVSAFGVIKVQS